MYRYKFNIPLYINISIMIITALIEGIYYIHNIWLYIYSMVFYPITIIIFSKNKKISWIYWNYTFISVDF